MLINEIKHKLAHSKSNKLKDLFPLLNQKQFEIFELGIELRIPGTNEYTEQVSYTFSELNNGGCLEKLGPYKISDEDLNGVFNPKVWIVLKPKEYLSLLRKMDHSI